MGFYAKHKLNVEVVKTAGWAVIRDKTLNGEYDAAHMDFAALLLFARQRLGRAKWSLVAPGGRCAKQLIGPGKEELRLARPLQTEKQHRRQGNLLGIGKA